LWLSPDDVDWIAIEQGVRSYERQVFELALRYQQAVKRILVVQWKRKDM